MLNTIVWALLTGLITGGVLVGIVLVQHQRRLARWEPEMLDHLQRPFLEPSTRRVKAVVHLGDRHLQELGDLLL